MWARSRADAADVAARVGETEVDVAIAIDVADRQQTRRRAGVLQCACRLVTNGLSCPFPSWRDTLNEVAFCLSSIGGHCRMCYTFAIICGRHAAARNDFFVASIWIVIAAEVLALPYAAQLAPPYALRGHPAGPAFFYASCLNCPDLYAAVRSQSSPRLEAHPHHPR